MPDNLVVFNAKVVADFSTIPAVYHKVLLSTIRGLVRNPYPEDAEHVAFDGKVLIQTIVRGPYSIYFGIDEPKMTVEILQIIPYPQER
jgi:hypothetical protein